ncbi:hypothetical protein [Hymenobacter weizhouensis]|uniref:hypothetical protein n=1 Tax=Hymenobacter sp. YIM 151500-1 TaxID=2987689 RepID=UPI0022266D38|nr:hypothetical protein [Hymenobacter sp. YIM 151500-1]UYZ62158.1 hypothetical protein OIS53_14245 [Hymenobacter sp. YIM 151500-1]
MPDLLARLRLPHTARRWVVPLFFGGLFVLGALLHRDYGVSWDEPTDHLNGLVNVKYVAGLVMPERVRQEPSSHLIPELEGYRDNDHGVIFEVPLSVLSYLLVHHDSRAYFFLRHFLIFGVFQLGVWAVYRIGRTWLGDWRWGLLAAGLLVLSPRLFAESFTNGKDILFLGLFAFGMSTLVSFTTAPSAGRAAGHGLATALATDARILGVLLVAFTVVMVGLDLLDRPAVERGRRLRLLGLYVAVAAAGTVVGWPYLWADPVGHFVAAFRSMGHYRWPFTNLYLGQYYSPYTLPWHYAPVWILITTPLPYVLAALLGLGFSARSVLRARPWLAGLGLHRLDLLIAGWLLGPLLLVIALNSSLYDTWRHLYFVYPALVLLAARGVQGLAKAASPAAPGPWLRPAATLLLLGALLETGRTAGRMVQLHPFQHLYYSFLPAEQAERLFDRDYWGLSVRQGLEWLTRQQPTGPLRIHVRWPMHNPLYNNSLMLPPEQRQRIRYVPADSADYFLTTYRWHPQPFADSVGTEIYTVRAEGIRILSIFRKPPTP